MSTLLEIRESITANIDSCLAVNKYEVDEQSDAIKLVNDPSDNEFAKLMILCPAAVYRVDEQGVKSWDYAGCLECGTCRIACGDTIINSWRYPGSTMGVEYRYG